MDSNELAALRGAGAVLSPCKNYRYALWREFDWLLCPRWCLFVMLNPSTADAIDDDATIRRVCGFAQRWQFGAVAVVNLFAWRSTDPAGLVAAADPVGPGNDDWLRRLGGASPKTCVAWGAGGSAEVARLVIDRQRTVLPLLRDPVCLGTTTAGFPRHPVRLPYAVEPAPFEIDQAGES